MRLIKVKNVYSAKPMYFNSDKLMMVSKGVENKVVITLDDNNVFEIEETEESLLEQLSPGWGKKK